MEIKKKLNKQQLKKFKQLYRKGYSARLIFANLGQPYDDRWIGCNQAAGRLIAYRKKLGLPPRGVGFRGIRYPDVNSDRQRQRLEQRRQKRIETLERLINIWSSKIEKWKKEHQQLISRKL